MMSVLFAYAAGKELLLSVDEVLELLLDDDFEFSDAKSGEEEGDRNVTCWRAQQLFGKKWQSYIKHCTGIKTAHAVILSGSGM